MRVYQDPTYSIRAVPERQLPIVVTRFYLEVSTKFTRNRITISDCFAAHEEQYINSSSIRLEPRRDYCDNSTFDTQDERAPNGVTHMDRISMKKFKFSGSTDVFLQCKMRACAQRPCGVCRRKLSGVGSSSSGSGSSSRDGLNDRALQSDLFDPKEGVEFTPVAQLSLNPRDKSALVFGGRTDAVLAAFGVRQSRFGGSNGQGGSGNGVVERTEFELEKKHCGEEESGGGGDF